MLYIAIILLIVHSKPHIAKLYISIFAYLVQLPTNTYFTTTANLLIINISPYLTILSLALLKVPTVCATLMRLPLLP